MKIPFSLLNDFIHIARNYSNESEVEIHADIYLNLDNGTFFTDFPKQNVSKYFCEVTEEPLDLAMKFFDIPHRKVLEIHSHNTMSPIPSPTDNQAERTNILYVIVGKLQNFFPEITCRTFDLEKQIHIPLKIHQIFEHPFTELHEEYELNTTEVSL